MTITSHIDIFAEILNSSFFTMKQSEIKKKYPYVERDISWMYFNQRILLEAARPEEHPVFLYVPKHLMTV